MEALFETEGLVFRDIITYPHIQIWQGKVTFITGESGSGKSTLLRLLNAVQEPTAGMITYRGKNLAEWDTILLRREVILAGQAVYLFDGTILENFEFFFEYRDETPPEAEYIIRYLELCCIYFPVSHSVTSMSGGERQRVFLALCLAFRPNVLLMDEPTSALDTETADQLMKNVTHYCRQKQITMLVVSHDQRLTEKHADVIIEISKEK